MVLFPLEPKIPHYLGLRPWGRFACGWARTRIWRGGGRLMEKSEIKENNLKNLMKENHLELFRKTCFGYFIFFP